MPKIITIFNQKGGVGKTTTAINLAACLAESNYNILLIDADQQGNCTSSLGIANESLETTFYHFLMKGIPIDDAIIKTSIDRVDLIPANSTLIAADYELISQPNKESYLKKKLNEEEEFLKKYDFILIDSPPSLNFLSANILTAANYLLIPMQPQYLAMQGLASLLNNYKSVKLNHNQALTILGVVITMHSKTNLSKDVIDDLKKSMGDLVLDTVIPINVKVGESTGACTPVVIYDKKATASIAYKELTDEILRKIK